MRTSVLRKSITGVLAFAGAIALVVTTPAASTAQIAAPQAIPAATFSLDVNLTSMASAVAAFERQLGTAPVPVRDLPPAVGTRTCDAQGEQDAVASVSPAPTALRCWSGADRTNDYMPQGITSTSDASSTNFYDGRQALAVTSYRLRADGTDEPRVTFLPNFGNETYLHIQLVYPSGSAGGNVDCHTGGSVWYGHYLIVACTEIIKVFDWRKIYKVGDQHIMPQVGTITGNALSRFSSLGLDRASDPDLLVVSQWATSCKALTIEKGNDCSVFRFELPQSGTLTNGTLPAYDAFNTAFVSMQGAVSQRDQFWFSSSDSSSAGTLHTWPKGTNTVRNKGWTVGAESLSHWNRGARPGVLLNVTEHPNKRVILAVETTDYP